MEAKFRKNIKIYKSTGETRGCMWKLIDRKKRNLISIEGVIYRPPKQSLQEFLNDLDLLLSIIRLSKKNKKVLCYDRLGYRL